jgi:hypothetical protein
MQKPFIEIEQNGRIQCQFPTVESNMAAFLQRKFLTENLREGFTVWLQLDGHNPVVSFSGEPVPNALCKRILDSFQS